MATSVTDIDADLVAPNLSVGSVPVYELKKHGYAVVVLCAEEHQDVKTDITMLHLPLLDTEQPGLQKVRPQDLVGTVKLLHGMRQNGKHILVTCAAGINRSAYVAALVLVESGWTAAGAIERIRRKRGPTVSRRYSGVPFPLNNRRFVAAIKKYARSR